MKENFSATEAILMSNNGVPTGPGKSSDLKIVLESAGICYVLLKILEKS